MQRHARRLAPSVRVIVVGAGRWGRVHCQRWGELLGRPVDLIIDPRRPELLGELPWRPSLAHCLPSELEGALAVVSTPITELAESALKLIRAGVTGLMIEKPGALSAQELQPLVPHARREQVRVAVGYIERFNPATEPLLRALSGWWLSPPEQRSQLQIKRSSRAAPRLDVPLSHDLWCHDLNLLLYAAQRTGAVREALTLKVRADGRLMLAGRLVGQLSSNQEPDLRQWAIGAQLFNLGARGLYQAQLDPLSEECLAFALWATQGVCSPLLCTLDEAIETLNALPPLVRYKKQERLV